jgi:hypothetical protein
VNDEGLQLSAMTPLESANRVDHQLVKWFSRHGGAWTGNAAELLAALRTGAEADNDSWPQSPGALYAYVESHQQILRSFGVAVRLHDGYPRMISLRSCSNEQLDRKEPSAESARNGTFTQELPIAAPNANGHTSEGVCDDAAEALLTMVRKAPAVESGKPSTISKLTGPFKRAWTRGPRST